MAKIEKIISFNENEGKILLSESRRVGVLSITSKAWVEVDNLKEVAAHQGDIPVTGLCVQSEMYTDKRGVQHTTKVWR